MMWLKITSFCLVALDDIKNRQKEHCHKSSLHSKQVCLFVGLVWCQKRVIL